MSAHGRIVLVEDNDATRYAVSRVLTAAGYRVTPAPDGETGIRLAVAERPDLVLLDVKLPDVSGYDVVRRLRGDPATAFFIIIDGWVKLYRSASSGDDTVIDIMTKGQTFAESVAFTGGRYVSTAEAVSEARVARIPADHIVRCIRQSPDIALSMIASISSHMHHLIQQVEQLKAQSGVQRVAEFLASLSAIEQGHCAVALPYDKVLIAGRLGLTPESLSRAFARLRSIGVVVDNSHVMVKDVAKLRQLASDDRSAVRGTLRAVR